MSKEEILKQIHALAPWYFLVELTPGIFTIPREQWATHWHTIITQDYMTRILFPLIDMLNKKSPSDTTIMDIGCNEGWLSLIFQRMGFKRIVGIDPNEANIKKAEFLKKHFGLNNVEFILGDINNFKTTDKFDIAVMFGVINHIHNPVGILQNIHSFTNDYLILDLTLFVKIILRRQKRSGLTLTYHR
ncbi:MAG: class I SAM-dependent methyltransferase [Nitrospirae bacterium]|nr:class I SAM-dependent methyltransferase [Nitrospirota bacterium]